MRLYLCDESGDPGASAESGASRLFVVCLVGYPDGGSAANFQAADAQLRKRLGWRDEFRWSKLSQWSRDNYFEGLVDNLPQHHAIVFFYVYTKAKSENLTPDQARRLRAAVETIKREFRHENERH